MPELQKHFIGNEKRWILILITVVLLFYYPLNFAPLNSVDDQKLIEHILNSRFHIDIFIPSSQPYYFRPLVGSTFFMDKYLHLCDAALMHLENVILHVFNSVIMFYISLSLFKKINIAGITALIFAIHPINTEAVNWISARTDLMAGLFCLLAFLMLIKKTYISLIASAICYLAALLCKESAIGFFLFSFIFVLYLYRKEYELKKIFLFILLITTATYLYLLMRYPELRFWESRPSVVSGALSINQFLPEGKSHVSSIGYQIGVCFKVIGFYFKKLIFPWPLNFTIIHINKKFYLIVGIITFLTILYLLIKEKGFISCFLIWSLCFIAPAILVPLRKLAWTPLAERYVYISSCGIALLLSFSIFSLYKSRLNPGIKKIVLYSFGSYLLAFSVSTVHRNYIWQDNCRLYMDCVKKSPDFGPVHNELGIALLKKGKIKEAKKEFEIADRLTKGYDYNIIAKGNILLLEHDKLDPKEGLKRYDKLIKETKNNKLMRSMLHSAIRYIEGLILEDKIKDKSWLYKKEISYLKALSSLDETAFCYYRIGQLYLALKDKEKALLYFKKAYKYASEDAYFATAALKLIKKLEEKDEK